MKRIFVGRSSATVKKICEVWRKMDLFRQDSVPPNQLLYQFNGKDNHYNAMNGVFCPII
jgi:hypothetical protein